MVMRPLAILLLALVCVSLGHFISVLLAFIVFDLVSSVSSQEIGCEERLRNDACRVGCIT